MIEQRREFQSIVGVDAIIVHDAERIVGLRHMQPGERPPCPADRVEVAAPALLQPIDLGELGFDDLPRLLEAAARGIDQAQAAERQRDGVGQPPTPDVDQLQAAAAEIAGKAVGGMNAGHDAERGKLGLLGA